MQDDKNYQFSVDLGGMISILSEHLYSSPDVFLRELIQNGADAIKMRTEFDPSFKDGEIDIRVTPGKTISFRDNGTGLTEEEIHKFVAVIGQSSKRGSGSYIGRFGIGLLSCFIVTDSIIMRTRSVRSPDSAVEWHGFADGRYSVRNIPADIPIGTEVIFDAAKDKEKFFSAQRLLDKACYYALPLPYPIYVSDNPELRIRANSMFTVSTGAAHEAMLETGKRIFGTDTDFLDVIPLESPEGLFSGAAYIIPYTVSAAGSGNRHRIYLKDMLLTENGATLLPEWAFFVRCIINTYKLSPTASREDFYRDDALRRAKEQISDCISRYLERLSFTEPEMLMKIGKLHGTALRSVASENEQLFRIFMPYFHFDTSYGNISGEDILAEDKPIFYTPDIDIFRQLKPIFAQQDVLLVNGGHVHNKELMMFAAKLGMADVRPLRESMISDVLSECPDPDEYDGLVGVFEEALAEYGCKAVMKQFEPAQITCLFSPNADAELKRDIARSKEKGDSMFADMLDAFDADIGSDAAAVLYLNASNELINELNMSDDLEKLTTFARILYVQALISGGFPVYAREMNIMNENLIKLIEWGI